MYFNSNDAMMGLAGGLLIGLASALFLLGNGRIAGISGLLGGLLRGEGHWRENLLFLAGLIGVPVLYGVVVAAPQIGVTGDIWLLVVAGLAVGIGTRLGSGCTSGHGVCGMSRLSTRSITATLVFIAVGFAVATVIRPVLEAA